MKKLIFSILLCMPAGLLSLYAQPDSKAIRDGYFASETSDILFWNDKRYLIDQSPLNRIDGYEMLFGEYAYTDLQPPHLYHGFASTARDKDYSVDWKIVHDTLFAGKVIPDISKKGDSMLTVPEKYSRFEKMVGQKFAKNPAVENSPRSNKHGVIPATWFSDTLYVRQARPVPTRETLHQTDVQRCENDMAWERTPITELIFRNGALVESREIQGKLKEVLIPIDKDNKDLNEEERRKLIRIQGMIVNTSLHDRIAEQTE